MLIHMHHNLFQWFDLYRTIAEMENQISWQRLHSHRWYRNSRQESLHFFSDIPKLAHGTRGLLLFTRVYSLSDKTTTLQSCREDSIALHPFQCDLLPGSLELENLLVTMTLVLLYF